jgi:Flp pilus assembly pilin Flp
MKALLSYWRDEEGMITVEYALLLSLVVTIALSTWRALSDQLCEFISQVTADIPSIGR